MGFLDGASIDAPTGPGQVRFERNGFVTGSDGCNGFGYSMPDGERLPADGLRFEVVDSEILFTGSPISTLIGCHDTRYENRLRHVLRDVVTYDIDGPTLTLVASDGDGVVFEARP